METFTFALKRNIMGGTNVLVSRNGVRYHVASYSSVSAARRAIKTGAVIRRAVKAESA